MGDMFNYIFTDPVNGDLLDTIGQLFSVTRGVNETDDQLRKRINYVLRYNPSPSSPHLLLLVLLEKLGLKSGTTLLDTYLPIGYPRR